jgi:hypothetical protein
VAVAERVEEMQRLELMAEQVEERFRLVQLLSVTQARLLWREVLELPTVVVVVVEAFT